MDYSIDGALEAIKKQQTGKEGTAAYMVGEQLKDICRVSSRDANLILNDLDKTGMGIVDAEKKIKAYADAHKTGSFACVPPDVAESILRKFYGLQKPEADKKQAAPVQTEPGKVIDLADFLG